MWSKYTICGVLSANQILEVVDLWMFNPVQGQINHTQLFPVKGPCGHAAYCCAGGTSAAIKVMLFLHDFLHMKVYGTIMSFAIRVY